MLYDNCGDCGEEITKITGIRRRDICDSCYEKRQTEKLMAEIKEREVKHDNRR